MAGVRGVPNAFTAGRVFVPSGRMEDIRPILDDAKEATLHYKEQMETKILNAITCVRVPRRPEASKTSIRGRWLSVWDEAGKVCLDSVSA